MTADMKWFASGVAVSLRKFGLVKPGQTAVEITSTLLNTGDEDLAGLRVLVLQMGNSLAHQWVQGTAQALDATGTPIGDPAPFDLDTFPLFAGPFPPNAGVRCTYTVVVPNDAPLDGIGAPWRLRAREE